MGDVTRLLNLAADGDRDALDAAVAAVQTELHARAVAQMRSERGSHTLQPTALVHEVYMRLCREKAPDYQGRAHFLAIASKKMREVLKNHARDRGAQKRGGGWDRVQIESGLASEEAPVLDALALDEALDRLAAVDKKLATVAELRIFGGLSAAEIAEQMNVSKRTAERDLRCVLMALLKDCADHGASEGDS